ncbi:hypothetical protein JT359_04665 [Candidatus Poribacteria bacterium]|nr:hypothetical protein [Candidatus Poribacteria bacterium]
MLGDFLTNKWILSGVGFLIVFTIVCMMWYQYDTAPYKQQAANTKKILSQLEERQKISGTINKKEQTETKVSTAEKPFIHEDVNKSTLDNKIEENRSKKPYGNPTETRGNDVPKKIGVSPFGLGPYPDIPEGFAKDPSRVFDPFSINTELIQRVRIKLYNQGIITTGGTRSNKTGLVYPTVKGEVYASWSYTTIQGLGKIKYATRIGGSRDAMSRIEENVRIRESTYPIKTGQIIELDIPSDVVVKSRREGIEPYSFLDLTMKNRTK